MHKQGQVHKQEGVADWSFMGKGREGRLETGEGGGRDSPSGNFVSSSVIEKRHFKQLRGAFSIIQTKGAELLLPPEGFNSYIMSKITQTHCHMKAENAQTVMNIHISQILSRYIKIMLGIKYKPSVRNPNHFITLEYTLEYTFFHGVPSCKNEF